MCLALLEEIAAGIEQPRKHYVETRSNLSEGYVSLGSSDFLVLGRSALYFIFRVYVFMGALKVFFLLWIFLVIIIQGIR